MQNLASSRLVILRSVIVEAGANLRARRMQAALSAFGIATGIAAVVLLVSLVSGVHRLALQQMNAAGANIVTVTADADASTRAPTGPQLALLGSDVDDVLRSSPYFDLATAQNSASAVVRGVQVASRSFLMNRDTGRAVVVQGQRAYTAQIRGLTPHGFEMQGLALASGRLPSRDEFEAGAKVVVLGADAARQVFGSEDAVGRTVVLGDWPFHVAGILDWLGEPDGEFRNSNDRLMFMPFRTVGTIFRGNMTAQQLSLRVRTPGTEAAAVADARGILTRRASRLGQASGRFEFTNAADRLAQFTLIITGLKLLVAMVGGIGLFVGAVGVANVLLVSVRERTQEIGVRRAIGARKGDVFIGFLCEALVLTVGGGALGITAAWVLTKIATLFPIPDGAEPHISFLTATIAVTLLAIVGIAAGVGPARRAAAIDPAEALRGE